MFFKVFSVSTLLLATALLTTACGRQAKPNANVPPIDGRDAYFMAMAAVSFGPRPSGSVASLRQLEWIAAEARTAGASDIKIKEFKENTPEGMVSFRNLVVEIKGRSPRFLVVGAHHDTKKIANCPDFVGANDGGSGVGLALHMLKSVCLSKIKPPHTLRFVFFDGEECFLEYSSTDGLFGSRHLAKEWEDSGDLKRCDGVILLDMIGDKELNVTFPAGADRKLVDLAMACAKDYGCEATFTQGAADMIDDHTPFQRKGIPTIDFIDFDYGPENHYWHTSADTIDKIQGESFTTVGQVAMELLWKIPVGR